MPARGEAGTWLLAESRAREKLADVLEERAVALGAFGLDEFAWLPFEQQKKLQQRFHQRWLESEDGRHFAQTASQITSSTDAYHRTLESYYRKSHHEDYGGRLWQYCLMALGCLPPRLIAISQRCHRRAHRGQPRRRSLFHGPCVNAGPASPCTAS